MMYFLVFSADVFGVPVHQRW